ncbi:winged helix-turn-helix domain-containing protein [Streptomyces sp. RKND-216]|uniref:winged helix-turn-helix domain-containing protein n=1 Tax=Streptomyces sp. RKND-216 TaxID=2562581 RepID=UPI0014461F4B|nr:winged helix-turn-helix domain-containing protein [Streptomyces sp. RKND-216]
MSGDSHSAGGERRPRDVVVQALRQRISCGDLRVGQQVPTQARLSEEYDVPRGAVRRALEVLEDEGLIRRARQGTSAQVVRAVSGRLTPNAPTPAKTSRAQRERERAVRARTHLPRSAGLELAERLTRAFQQDRVTVDAYCSSGETLASALAGPMVAMTADAPRPESVRVRVLLPDPDRALALPQVIGDPEDARPRARLREVMDNIYGSLRHSLRMLEVREIVPEVRVEARRVAITPTQRVYILNGEEVLAGHYRVQPRRVELYRDPMEIYDVLGLEGMLFRHTAVPGDQVTEAYVQQTQQWFDSLWETIARPTGE